MKKTYTATITKTFDFDEMVETWWMYSGQFLEDYNEQYHEHITPDEDLEEYYLPENDNYPWDNDEIAVMENNYKAFFNDLISCAKEKGYIKKFSEEEK